MEAERLGVMLLAAVGAVTVLFYATSKTPDRAIPPTEFQGEAQFAGLGAGLAVNAKTPLDIRTSVHFFDPFVNQRDSTNLPTIKLPVRYPTVPGGNISYVMHKGWGSFLADSPYSNSWFANPPEASVL